MSKRTTSDNRPRSTTGGRHLPVDSFLRTLAEAQGSQGIGVILSGTASDGTMGVRAVKAEGGITFAQDPASAAYDGMPRSAIDSECVDFVLPPEGIARELSRLSRHPHVVTGIGEEGADEPRPSPKSKDGLGAILNLLRAKTSVDFGSYKPPTIRRRITRRMALVRVDTMAEYARQVSDSPNAIWNWRTLDLRLVLERWAENIPAERVHVLPLATAAPREAIWHEFGGLLGLSTASYDLSQSSPNESMGVVEAETLRRVNQHLGSFERSFDRGVYIRTFLADERLVPRRGERFWPEEDRIEECRVRGRDDPPRRPVRAGPDHAALDGRRERRRQDRRRPRRRQESHRRVSPADLRPDRPRDAQDAPRARAAQRAGRITRVTGSERKAPPGDRPDQGQGAVSGGQCDGFLHRLTLAGHHVGEIPPGRGTDPSSG
jgi:hypothetical protein